MNIYLTRHGQTELNRTKRMQGRIDAQLNENGKAQAQAAAEKTSGVRFDAVYASPLDRAIETASIIGHAARKDIITDSRIIEADFGKYDGRKYFLLGPALWAYWGFPEIFPAPKGVETIVSLTGRSRAFLKELKSQPYENVLIVCHGGIMRALSGCLEGRKNGIKWRPKPKNCEIRIYKL